MKKNSKSFAQRAKKLVKRYKRADWDAIEKNALEASLSKLQEEQEAYKQANQIGEYACGGKLYWSGGTIGAGSSPEDISRFQRYAGIKSDGIWGPQTAEAWENLGTVPTMIESQGVTSNITNTPTENISLPQAKTISQEQSEFSPYKTSIAPSLISGATSTLGNLYLANQQKNLPEVKLPRLSPRTIDLERGRQAVRREATRAGQRVKHGVRQGARTRGEYMANRVAAEANITGKLGETLSASYEKEELVNANMAAGMDRFNAEMAAKEEMVNKANQIKNKAEREAYIAAAIGTIPQMTRDITQTRRQDALINSLGEDYGWYMYDQPDRKFYQPKQRKIAYRGKKGLQLAE